MNKCDAITEQLGIKVGLSATEVQRRLREAVVIEADVSVVSPKAVCRNVTMLVFASLTRDRADIIDAFKEAIRVAPEIMSGYRITVAADWVMRPPAQSLLQGPEKRAFF